MLAPARSDLFPPPTSRDPIHPGVLVRGSTPPELWVGTENGRAPGQGGTVDDGPGVVLRVERGDGAGGFAGTWGPAGRAGRAGYFCARYAVPPPSRTDAGPGRVR